ncbi:MAG: nitrite/sulfite reductase [Thermocladium sp.]
MSTFKYSDIHKAIYPRRHEGIYKNRGDNPWISIRIRQGINKDPSKWFSNQLRIIAEVSRKYGDGRAMLGTRGDVEIVKVDYRLFDEVVSRLRDVDLDPRDSCGNSVRNPIPCPSNHCPYAHVNAEALSTFIGDYFRHRAEYEGASMPHRFKISISACEEACAIPISQDIGIVAKANGKFDIYLGGGVGEHAFTAKLIFTDIDIDDLLPIIVGAIDVFKMSGERRGFKWVPNKHGIDWIRDRILEVASKVKPNLPKPSIGPHFIDSKIIRIHYPTGWVKAEDLEKIAGLADEHGLGYVVLFNNQTIYVPVKDIDGELSYEVRDPGPFRHDGPATIACLGSELCPPGLIDTSGLGSKIHVNLKGDKPVSIHISGCTHDCGLSWVSDIGLEPFGSRTRILVTVGGGPTRLGKVVCTVDPNEAETITKALLGMLEKHNCKDAGELVDRVGIDAIREELSRIASSFKAPDNGLSIFGPN